MTLFVKFCFHMFFNFRYNNQLSGSSACMCGWNPVIFVPCQGADPHLGRKLMHPMRRGNKGNAGCPLQMMLPARSMMGLLSFPICRAPPKNFIHRRTLVLEAHIHLPLPFVPYSNWHLSHPAGIPARWASSSICCLAAIAESYSRCS